MKIWLGKIAGAFLGLASGGPFGLLVGVFAGHLVDQALGKMLLAPQAEATTARKGQVQQVFFRATFRVMGRLAKADGRVSEEEIAAATNIMDQMGLNGGQRQSAIQFFTEGKDPEMDLMPDLNLLRNLFAQRAGLAQMFMEIQLMVAYSDGRLSLEERRLFDKICKALGISAFQFEWINGRVQAAMSGAGQRHAAGQSQEGQLRNAYAVLGVKADASDDELKKAYRKLMSQHHPDKLVAKGLPEEMMKLAKEKTQEIQTAYDLIRKSRGKP